MADADVLISAGSGTKIDTRTVGAGTDEHRQVMVVGDPATADAVAEVINAQPTAADYGLVTRPLPPAVTKGTQGTTGFAVQDLKDAGRSPVVFYMAGWVVATNAAVLQSLTATRAGATVAATTTPAVVTAGKTFRVQHVHVGYLSLATVTNVLVALRANTAGVVAVTSPVYGQVTAGSQAAVAGVHTWAEMTIPDGLEFAAGTGVGITVAGFNATGGALASGYVNVMVTGFEY